jgi:hypothetical protein
MRWLSNCTKSYRRTYGNKCLISLLNINKVQSFKAFPVPQLLHFAGTIDAVILNWCVKRSRIVRQFWLKWVVDICWIQNMLHCYLPDEGSCQEKALKMQTVFISNITIDELCYGQWNQLETETWRRIHHLVANSMILEM